MSSNQDVSPSKIKKSNSLVYDIETKLHTFVSTFVIEVAALVETYRKILSGDKIDSADIPKGTQAVLFYAPKWLSNIYNKAIIERFGKKYAAKEEPADIDSIFNSEILKSLERENLVKIATEVFQSYEFQFLGLTWDSKPIEAIKTVARDAAHRLLNSSESHKISAQRIVDGKSILHLHTGYARNLNTRGFKIKFEHEEGLIDWNTDEMFDNSGLVEIVDGYSHLYTNGKSNINTYGYRKKLPEDDLTAYQVGKIPKDTFLYPKYDECKDFYEKQRTILLDKREKGEGDEIEKRTVQIIRKVLTEVNKRFTNTATESEMSKESINKMIQHLNHLLNSSRIIDEAFIAAQKERDAKAVERKKQSELIREFKFQLENWRINFEPDKKPIKLGTVHSFATFVGRDKELATMKSMFNSTPKRKMCITGPEAIGKTTLAKKFAEIHAKKFYNIIFVRAETIENMKNTFKFLANRLGISLYETKCDLYETMIERNIKKVVDEVYTFLNYNNEGTLFIVDNAIDYYHIKDYFFFDTDSYGNVYTIITSQSEEWKIEWNQGERIKLKEFSQKEAVDFVYDTLSDENDDDVKLFAEEFKNFPLAHKLAVAFIEQENESKKRKEKCTVKEYLTLYENFKDKLSIQSDDIYQKVVQTTSTISLEKVAEDEQCGGLALQIFRILAYISPDNVEVVDFFSHLEEDTDKLWNAVELLEKYSLVNLETGVISVHRMVQKATRLNLAQINMEESVLKETLKLLKPLNYDEHATYLWEHCSEHSQLVKDYYPGLFYGPHKNTPLQLLAAHRNDSKSIKNILEHLNDDSSMNYRRPGIEESALYKAAQNGNVNVVKYLLERGAKIHTDLKSPLHIAAANGHLEVVKCMYEKDQTLANVEIAREFKGTPIDEAALNGHVEVVKVLKPNDNDVHMFHASFRKSIVNDAIRTDRNFEDVLKKYDSIDNKVIQSKIGYFKESILDFVVKRRNKYVMGRMLKYELDLNASDIYQKTPLHFAASIGNIDAMQILINNGAIVDMPDYLGETPLFSACVCGIQSAYFLLQNGAKFDAINKDGTPVLHKAAKRSTSSVLEMLIQKGANPNALDRCGRSPLHYAAMGRNVDAMKFLTAQGMDFNLKDSVHNRTPLGYICYNYFKVEAIQRMIQFHKDPYAESNYSLFTEYEAKLLIRYYPDFNIRIDNGNSALHLAVHVNCMDVVEALLKKGADPNVADLRLQTPLHVAAENGRIEALKVLIAHGGNVKAVDSNGRTCLDFAREFHQAEIIHFLTGINENKE
ncbi:uncharacterized protein LOC143910082 [Arctopsyche grandis]|uniref:uncharacterized protein LOC143910082 n=1 Tax=Arctopsyche grandis TaxID=121162 RepID=UPI00406D9A41